MYHGVTANLLGLALIQLEAAGKIVKSASPSRRIFCLRGRAVKKVCSTKATMCQKKGPVQTRDNFGRGTGKREDSHQWDPVHRGETLAERKERASRRKQLSKEYKASNKKKGKGKKVYLKEKNTRSRMHGPQSCLLGGVFVLGCGCCFGWFFYFFWGWFVWVGRVFFSFVWFLFFFLCACWGGFVCWVEVVWVCGIGFFLWG